MGAGNFFAGLLGGYTGTLVKNEERQYQQNLQAKELRIKGALQAWDEAMTTGDKNAMSVASQNLDEAISALGENGKKKKAAKPSAHGGLLQSIMGAVSGHHAQNPSSLPPVPGMGKAPNYDPGMSFPQTGHASPTGDFNPLPQRGAPSPAPATPQAASPRPASLPPMPRRPVTMQDVMAAMPTLQQRSVTAAQAQTAGLQATYEAEKANIEKTLGRPLKPEEALRLQQEVYHLTPTSERFAPIAGSYLSGDQIPANATMPGGLPIPQEMRKAKNHFEQVMGPGGQAYYVPAKPIGSSSSQAIKVNAPGGIPATVTGPEGTYAVGDPNMPPAYKALVGSYQTAHQKSRKEHQADAEARDAAMISRMRTAAGISNEKQAQALVRKRVNDYEDAKNRLNRMEINERRAMGGDQQAMVSLLSDHIGMTALAQKGGRMTMALYNEAERSRPWLQNIMARINGGEPLSGIVLTPEQMQQMVTLAQEVTKSLNETAQTEAHDLGVDMSQVAPGLASPEGVKMIQVQIPGHPPGTIRADRLKDFKRKYPKARVIQ